MVGRVRVTPVGTHPPHRTIAFQAGGPRACANDISQLICERLDQRRQTAIETHQRGRRAAAPSPREHGPHETAVLAFHLDHGRKLCGHRERAAVAR
jgi:hypothetical protein